MTDETTTQTAVIPAQPVDMAAWGTSQEIQAHGKRIKALLPAAAELSDTGAAALAQAAILADANPYRGEIYAFPTKGKTALVDGYKLLVRWAQRQCPYVEKYTELRPDEMPEGAIGYRCAILRTDLIPTLHELVKAGASFAEAYEIAATSAVGIVEPADKLTRDGKPKPPPVGWTWEQVARKRALKNALNLSHGAPSPAEIRRERQRLGADPNEPTAADWRAAQRDLQGQRYNQQDLERLARLHASTRTRTGTLSPAGMYPEDETAL
jgi:hypothetical protein